MALTPVNPIIVDRYGRKAGMLIGAIVIIIGMVVAVTSKSIAQLAIGRFILGAGVSLLTMGATNVCNGDLSTSMERSSDRRVQRGWGKVI